MYVVASLDDAEAMDKVEARCYVIGGTMGISCPIAALKPPNFRGYEVFSG